MYFTLPRLDGGKDIISIKGITYTDSTGGRIQYLRGFSVVSYDKYEIGVPQYGYYEEILNSDDVKYGGSTTPDGEFYITKKKNLMLTISYQMEITSHLLYRIYYRDTTM